MPTTPAQPDSAVDSPAQDQNTDAPNGQTEPREQQPDSQRDGNSQPGVTTPNQPGVTTPDQPGVTAPEQGGPDQKLVQPGVTAPRVAPLPVPGQEQGEQVQPAGIPGVDDPDAPADELKSGEQPGDDVTVAPDESQSRDNQMNTLRGQRNDESTNQPDQQTQWTSPRMKAAPAAPVVQMDGAHTEVGANVNGGALLPGYVANTHHFNNLDGYVGTVGYRTPEGVGDAGVSVEFVEANQIKVTSYTHVTGFDDLKSEDYIDTTVPNAAKAAVEGWIKQQPGGAAALEAAGRVGRLPQGDIAPQTVNVAGATTQWGGTVQY